jgi:hypothetical protein
LYDFDAQADGDLSFKTGDRIEIVEKTASAEDWWTGKLNGQQGVFPGMLFSLPWSSSDMECFLRKLCTRYLVVSTTAYISVIGHYTRTSSGIFGGVHFLYIYCPSEIAPLAVIISTVCTKFVHHISESYSNINASEAKVHHPIEYVVAPLRLVF